MDSWSALNDHRRKVRDRWPKIWRLPIVPRSMRHAAAHVRPGAAVLDIGASDGRFGRKLPADAVYETLDPDPAVPATYRAASELPRARYDVVVCFEMIEHVTLEDAHAILRAAFEALKPGGKLFVSTPNVHHPWAYLRSATHVTPFCYDELGGLLELSGFSLDALYRCHRDALLQGALRVCLRPLYRAVGSDYAKSILAQAHRPAESTSPSK